MGRSHNLNGSSPNRVLCLISLPEFMDFVRLWEDHFGGRQTVRPFFGPPTREVRLTQSPCLTQLDCYWVGSSGFNFLRNIKGFFHKTHQQVQVLQGGQPAATKPVSFFPSSPQASEPRAAHLAPRCWTWIPTPRTLMRRRVAEVEAGNSRQRCRIGVVLASFLGVFFCYWVVLGCFWVVLFCRCFGLFGFWVIKVSKCWVVHMDVLLIG